VIPPTARYIVTRAATNATSTAAPSGSFVGALDAMLWNALAAVTAWPHHDLFANLP
jgi:hypothetical protein